MVLEICVFFFEFFIGQHKTLGRRRANIRFFPIVVSFFVSHRFFFGPSLGPFVLQPLPRFPSLSKTSTQVGSFSSFDGPLGTSWHRWLFFFFGERHFFFSKSLFFCLSVKYSQ